MIAASYTKTASQQEQEKIAAKTAALNAEMLDGLASGDIGRMKTAALTADDYIRGKLRESLLAEAIIPVLPLTPDQMQVALGSEEMYRIEEREPDSPGSITVGYGSRPSQFQFFGNRWALAPNRIRTEEFEKDVTLLRSYKMDLRQLMSENALRDMLHERDKQMLRSIEAILIGPDQVVPGTAVKQWQVIGGGVSRESWAKQLEILPSTYYSLNAQKILLNQITSLRMLPWGREELGGDLAQTFATDGFTAKRFMGVDLIITIKRDLVPDNRFIHFGPDTHLGKHYEVTPTTMHVKAEYYYINFFHWWEGMLGFGSVAALGIADMVG